MPLFTPSSFSSPPLKVAQRRPTPLHAALVVVVAVCLRVTRLRAYLLLVICPRIAAIASVIQLRIAAVASVIHPRIAAIASACRVLRRLTKPSPSLGSTSFACSFAHRSMIVCFRRHPRWAVAPTLSRSQLREEQLTLFYCGGNPGFSSSRKHSFQPFSLPWYLADLFSQQRFYLFCRVSLGPPLVLDLALVTSTDFFHDSSL